MSQLLVKKTIAEKMAMYYGVKSSGHIISKAEDGDDDRTIKAIGNAFFFIDSDLDMLLPGCSTKSINDKGPNSNATAKIKFQSDHRLDTRNTVGRFDVLEERQVGDIFGIYFEGFIPDTIKGNDDLKNYKAGIFDNHSIGFRYKQLELAVLNGNDAERKLWDEWYPKAINPEEADKHGFFYVVKEIELWEISVVSFGANELTPYLGMKSQGDDERLKEEIISRFDSLEEQLKSMANSKEGRTNLKTDFLQMRQIITDLKLEKPSKKSTQSNEPDNNDTSEIEKSPRQLTKFF
jgi:phage head maturation protease